MKCGVKFCGGCNPGYDRGEAFKTIKDRKNTVDFVIANEDIEHDMLLVIGGCTSCCASWQQYQTVNGVIKMWNKAHIDKIVETLDRMEQAMKKQ